MGFFFLLAFIAVLIIYLSVAGYSIHWLRKRNKPKYVVWLAVAFWVLLPTWDTIISLSYHRYVCATEPDIGLTVYQTVPLDPKLFDKETGKPMIFDKYGNFDKSIVGERFKLVWNDKNQGQWPFVVYMREVDLVDQELNTKLAMLMDYQAIRALWWWGPLFGRMFDTPRIAGSSCLGKHVRGNLIREILEKPFISKQKDESKRELK